MQDFETVEGFGKLVETVDELYARPRRRCRYEDTPPMLGCVVASESPDSDQPDPRAAEDLVEAIAARLESRDGKPQVPYAMKVQPPEQVQSPADAALAELDAGDVLKLQERIAEIANALAMSSGGSYRFPRFWLLTWLMDQELTARDVSERRRMVRDLLYQRAVTRASDGGTKAGEIAAELPVWGRLLWIVLLPLYFWARHSGKVPGLGRTYRWFLKQTDVAPGNDAFFELGVRLSKHQWTGEKAEQVARLMVNAFLEDLRDDFRGAGWIHRYHTTFPTVLLGRISRNNGGYTLVRMVAEVRNDLRIFDPLLLITTSNRVPPLAKPPLPDFGAAEAGGEKQTLLGVWRKRMEGRSRQREIEAWLIAVTIGKTALPPEEPQPAKTLLQKAVAKATGTAKSPSAQPVNQPSAAETAPKYLHRVPRQWWRTRRGGALIGFVVLAFSFGGYAGFGYADDYRHCGDGFTWLGVEPATTSVTRIDGTCIGVTDGSNELLLPGRAFDEVRTTIYAQNQQSLALSKSQPDRPLITLIFMSSAAAQGSSDSVMTAEREQLAGMAVAQAVQLGKPAQAYEPLLRVLIANAGPQLRQGERVAKQLGRMAAGDPSIVAVVGMVQSRESTATTIRALAGVGLPTVAATLTADTMVNVSKLYFQVSPQNAREAKIAARHVSQLLAKGKDPFGRPLARKATIYKSDDPTDTYSQNLAADLRVSLTEHGVPVEVRSFTPGGRQPTTMDAGTAGSEACDTGGVVLYAARGLVDFPAFITGIADHCRSQPPYVLAGDDVTTFVADRTASGANRSVPFQYLSLALAPELSKDPPPVASDFYEQLDNLFPYEKSARGRTLDGHAALNYDAAYTVVLAVSYLRRDRVAINGGTVWTALQSVTDAGGSRRAYQGVTGRIDFGGTIGRRVPLNKPVTIVTFRNGQPVPAANLVCGGPMEPGTQPWCPFD